MFSIYRDEIIRLGRQSRPRITKFVAREKFEPGRGRRGGEGAEQGDKIHLVISQAIMPRRRGPGAPRVPRARARRRLNSYLTPIWARGARLADHPSRALNPRVRRLPPPSSFAREIVNDRMVASARGIGHNPRHSAFLVPSGVLRRSLRPARHSLFLSFPFPGGRATRDLELRVGARSFGARIPRGETAIAILMKLD